MRTGIMGGTFDPIHNTHMDIAQVAYAAMELDRVLFIPVGDPPHKRLYADALNRLSMVELAVQGLPWAQALDIEAKRRGTTYTVDTLTQLTERWPEDDFYFIIGADVLRDMPKWRDARRAMELCQLIAFPRIGMDERAMDEVERIAAEETGARVHRLSIAPSDTSSTEIRNRCQAGKSIADLVPPAVERYIEERRLYRSTAMNG